jgi:hypothetical protein
LLKFFTIKAPTTPVNPAIPSTDRSIEPSIRINVIAVEVNSKIAERSRILVKLDREKNLSAKKLKMIIKLNRAMNEALPDIRRAIFSLEYFIKKKLYIFCFIFATIDLSSYFQFQ